MVLRYTDKPYGGGRQTAANAYHKFPAGAQPMQTAPQSSATPVIIYGADGKAHWALQHRDSWRVLEPFKDFKSGKVQWRMNGEMIAQPLAWSPQPLQRKR